MLRLLLSLCPPLSTLISLVPRSVRRRVAFTGYRPSTGRGTSRAAKTPVIPLNRHENARRTRFVDGTIADSRRTDPDGRTSSVTPLDESLEDVGNLGNFTISTAFELMTPWESMENGYCFHGLLRHVFFRVLL